jgi:hypothetical protein
MIMYRSVNPSERSKLYSESPDLAWILVETGERLAVEKNIDIIEIWKKDEKGSRPIFVVYRRLGAPLEVLSISRNVDEHFVR